MIESVEEPVILIWKVNGNPETGPLSRYAIMWVQSQHGDALTLSDTVLTWGPDNRDPTTWDVKITRMPGITDDRIRYEISIPGLDLSVWAWIDHRS